MLLWLNNRNFFSNDKEGSSIKIFNEAGYSAPKTVDTSILLKEIAPDEVKSDAEESKQIEPKAPWDADSNVSKNLYQSLSVENSNEQISSFIIQDEDEIDVDDGCTEYGAFFKIPDNNSKQDKLSNIDKRTDNITEDNIVEKEHHSSFAVSY